MKNNWQNFINPQNHHKNHPSQESQAWLNFQAQTMPIMPINQADKQEKKPKICVKSGYIAPQLPIIAKKSPHKHHDNKLLTKLAECQYPIDATIDLHGCTAEQAWANFWQFLHYNVQNKSRCIRVITGKGKGILYDLVQNWCNIPEISQYIVASVDAKQKFGGKGVRIILLKNVDDSLKKN